MRLGNTEKLCSENSELGIICNLCSSIIHENIHKHLLSDSGTIEAVQKFYDKLQEKMPEYFNLLHKIPQPRQWIWILSLGINDAPHKIRRSLPIIEGTSISGKTDKNNPIYREKVIDQHNQIVKELPRDSIRIYTDGSKTKTGSGSGSVIYLDDQLIHKLSTPLMNCSNNFAELYAIYSSINWIQKNWGIKINRKFHYKIHIFTDSKISIDSLCLRSKSSNNHRLLNMIINIVSKANSPKLILHWIPSHIEMKINNGPSLKGIKGNMIADRLANTAARIANTENSMNARKYFEKVPHALLESVTELVSVIDYIAFKKATELNSSKPVSPSLDDFSLSDAKRSKSFEMRSVTS